MSQLIQYYKNYWIIKLKDIECTTIINQHLYIQWQETAYEKSATEP